MQHFHIFFDCGQHNCSPFYNLHIQYFQFSTITAYLYVIILWNAWLVHFSDKINNFFNRFRLKFNVFFLDLPLKKTLIPSAPSSENIILKLLILIPNIDNFFQIAVLKCFTTGFPVHEFSLLFASWLLHSMICCAYETEFSNNCSVVNLKPLRTLASILQS